jgi:hypothetical protein
MSVSRLASWSPAWDLIDVRRRGYFLDCLSTLFVNACVHGAIRDGRALYDEFKGNLSDDLPTRARHRRLNIPADLEEP